MFGETFIFPLLGEGQVPWAEFFAALDEIGYRGHLSVEFESWDYYRQVLGSDPVAAARLSLELLARLDPATLWAPRRARAPTASGIMPS
jgi:sugar phosphate isomerase/epimerase